MPYVELKLAGKLTREQKLKIVEEIVSGCAQIKRIRSLVTLCVKGRLGKRGVPAAVHLTRVAPSKLDDDNLTGAFKPVCDGLADALEVNDRIFVIHGDRPGPRLTFEQRSEGRANYAIVLELRYST